MTETSSMDVDSATEMRSERIASCTCEQEGDGEEETYKRERHTREDNVLVDLN